MSAGTIVITGGILAGVILLCIVAVLCYCRLQVVSHVLMFVGLLGRLLVFTLPMFTG